MAKKEEEKKPEEVEAKAAVPEADAAEGGKPARAARGAKKSGKRVAFGQIHIFATFNNTIVTVTDDQGNTLSWASAGLVGFKGPRKSTPFASRLATERAVKAAQDMGLQEIDMFVKGPGPGREFGGARCAKHGHEGAFHFGRYSSTAQRLPPTQAPQNVRK